MKSLANTSLRPGEILKTLKFRCDCPDSPLAKIGGYGILLDVCGRSSVGRTPPCQGEGQGFESLRPLFTWRRSQEVRQGSAKALFVGSNPTVAFRRSWGIHERMPILLSRGGGGIGRRRGLKILYLRKCVGSTPTRPIPQCKDSFDLCLDQ